MTNINIKILTIIAAIVLTAPMLTMTCMTVTAQTLPTVPTAGPLPSGTTGVASAPISAHLSFNPNPTGVGQTVLINMWTSPAPGANREHPEYDLIITDPSGHQTVEKMPSYPADGTQWTTFTPATAGNYTIQLVFPGTYFPAGLYLNGLYVNSSTSAPAVPLGGTGPTAYTAPVYYEPASTPVQQLTVQTNLIQSWPSMPLPTGYWTRPVNFEFREWWPILGNYPWWGPPTGIALSEWNQYNPGTTPAYNPSAGFYPWMQGPTSPHVVWDKQWAIEGIVGGDYGIASLGHEISGYGGKPSIILWGRAYQTYTAVNSTAPTSVTYWECYDIRTGQVYWSRPLYPGESAPTLIQYGTKSYSGSGVQNGDITPGQPALLSISSGFERTYDPYTGVMTGNYSISPLTSATYYENGFAYGIETNGTGATAQYFLINFTTVGTSTTLAARIVTNTTYPMSSLPGTKDYYSGFGAAITSVSDGGAFSSMILTGYNLWTGAVLWNKTINEPMYSGSANMADQGILVVLSANGYYLGYNEQTGAQVWQSPTMDYPWDSSAFGVYGVQSAYGLFYREAYSGIYAFNWTTGKIQWKFESPAVFQTESHYTTSNGTAVYPFNAQSIILDGMMYAYNAEHSPKTPYTRGWRTYCINATTGQEIWQVMLTGTNWFGGTDLAASDGYLSLGCDDGFQYYFGIGLSSATVTASPSVVSGGSQVLIQGTVMDQSPAQPNTPAVSDASMATQMEYLHKEMPITGIYGNATITGVPVTLNAVDANGTVTAIGTVVSNGYYGTFSYAWSPPSTGTYTITATFNGDDSYGASSAATSVAVTTATTTTATPTATPTTTTAPVQTQVDYTMTIIGMGIAIILAVIIVGILMLRKKP